FVNSPLPPCSKQNGGNINLLHRRARLSSRKRNSSKLTGHAGGGHNLHEHSRLFPEVPGDDEIQPARTEGESSLWHHDDADAEDAAGSATAEASLPHIDTGSLSTLFAAVGADHETSVALEADAPPMPPGVPRGYPRRRVARGK